MKNTKTPIKRKYSQKMQDTYNELLQACKTRKKVRDLGIILNKTNTHVVNYVNTLLANGHVEKFVLSDKTGLMEVLALSDYVPDNEFADEYRPRSRRTKTEDPQIYKWLGNPFRETVL